MTIKLQNAAWPADRLAEARAVVADVALHSDHLIGLACEVLMAKPQPSARTRGCCCW